MNLALITAQQVFILFILNSIFAIQFHYDEEVAPVG